jgi:hypothetical protein
MNSATQSADQAPDSRNAPTLPPPARVSVTRYKSGAPVDELLYRLSVGDNAGALDAAQALFDTRRIPVLVLPLQTMTALFGYRADLLLSCIDGATPLSDVIDASGMEMLDALRALGELLAENVIALC